MVGAQTTEQGDIPSSKEETCHIVVSAARLLICFQEFHITSKSQIVVKVVGYTCGAATTVPSTVYWTPDHRRKAQVLIKNLLLLDSEGRRVAVKYYTDEWPTNAAKLAFESSIFTKTHKTNARTEAEIVMFENNVVVYKLIQDLHFFVTGGDSENELALATVLQGFSDAVTLLLRGNVDQREALENLDTLFLCLDEIVDAGVILETDGNMIAGKVATHNLDDGASLSQQYFDSETPVSIKNNHIFGGGQLLYIFGGYGEDNTQTNKVHVYTPVMTVGLGPSSFSMAGSTLHPHHSGALIFMGGCNKSLEVLDDMFYLHTGPVIENEQDERKLQKLSLRKQLRLKSQEQQNVNPVCDSPMNSMAMPTHTQFSPIIDGKPLRGVLFSNNLGSKKPAVDDLRRQRKDELEHKLSRATKEKLELEQEYGRKSNNIGKMVKRIKLLEQQISDVNEQQIQHTQDLYKKLISCHLPSSGHLTIDERLKWQAGWVDVLGKHINTVLVEICHSVYMSIWVEPVTHVKMGLGTFGGTSVCDDMRISVRRKNGQSLGTLPAAGADSGDNIEC
ncbi:hypothetical protein M8C21_029518 [Ambrosia artemisiifolia]|uniref:AP complex mu/sigma subunit domain-containing protein n=1 Tax=Ambrosia artemisiifolia TaxID=4212 RepID=A0AAD5CZ62_AMBAR|nr:hypothetical protein M8C21_029518 [Ambrosia artemisiifolia]